MGFFTVLHEGLPSSFLHNNFSSYLHLPMGILFIRDFLDLVDLVMDFSFHLALVPSRLLSSQR